MVKYFCRLFYAPLLFNLSKEQKHTALSVHRTLFPCQVSKLFVEV